MDLLQLMKKTGVEDSIGSGMTMMDDAQSDIHYIHLHAGWLWTTANSLT